MTDLRLVSLDAPSDTEAKRQEMNTNQVLLGIGANLDGPKRQVSKAIERINQHADITLKARSSLYRSQPQGPQDQNDFVNAVVWIETALEPSSLLQATQAIEADFGRIKSRHWGERIIDLDILFFNNESISLEKPALCIPHPYAVQRDFVLIPAIEIAPDWTLPDETPLTHFLSSCATHHLQRID